MNARLIALLLILLAVVVYVNSLWGKFVFDDQQLVLQNPQMMNIHGLGDVFRVGLGDRRLLFLSYALNYYWSGTDTFSYHVFNVVLHALNTLLVFWIIFGTLRQTDDREFVAAAGAAVFAVHTLFTSAVSYIAGRSSVMCATFYFLAVLLFFKALDTPRRNLRIVYLLLTALSGLLAWQTKQEAITLPLFLAGVVFLRSDKANWRWILPLAAVPAVGIFFLRDEVRSLFRVVSENKILVSAGMESVLRPDAYFRTYLTSIIQYYFPRFLFPTGLSADPEVIPVEHWYSPEFLVSVLILGTLAWLALEFRKRRPLLSLGLVALMVSPLMAYAAIPLADVVLEHRAYIPGLGVAFLFAALFQWFAQDYRSVQWLALGVLVAVLGFMTVARNSVWANNLALWEDAAARAPAKPRPHLNLGQAYQEAQRFPDAIREYERALALKPDIHAAYSNLAAIYLDTAQYDKGEEVLRKVTSLSPDFTEGFINLGVLYIRRQQPAKALAVLNHAVAMNPESYPAHFNKGEALTQGGDFKAAVESYREAIRLRPDIESFHLTLGLAYSRAGDKASAEKEFLGLTNGSLAPDALRNLGVLRRDAGDIDGAMSYFRQAAGARHVFPELHHDLGILYLQKKMPDQAIAEFQTTLQQQPDYGPAHLNLALAYQSRSDLPAARQTLQAFIQQYGNTNSPFIAQAKQRLELLK